MAQALYMDVHVCLGHCRNSATEPQKMERLLANRRNHGDRSSDSDSSCLFRPTSWLPRQVLWGLLDRGRPPGGQKPWPGQWTLHLKESRVKVSEPERDIFDGIR